MIINIGIKYGFFKENFSGEITCLHTGQTEHSESISERQNLQFFFIPILYRLSKKRLHQEKIKKNPRKEVKADCKAIARLKFMSNWFRF